MKKRITEIINDLKDICIKECLSVSHDSIFKEAVSCYRGEQAGQKKSNEAITEKQSEFIKKNLNQLRNKGFDVDNIQYKNQANKIISEFIKLNQTQKKNAKPNNSK